jgi:hypothetical protein
MSSGEGNDSDPVIWCDCQLLRVGSIGSTTTGFATTGFATTGFATTGFAITGFASSGVQRLAFASIENAIGITISPSEKVADIEDTVAVAIVAFELEAIVEAIVVAILTFGEIDISIILDAIEIMIAKHLDDDGGPDVIELGPDADGAVFEAAGQVPTVGAPTH